jgi:hypothetical protein
VKILYFHLLPLQAADLALVMPLTVQQKQAALVDRLAVQLLGMLFLHHQEQQHLHQVKEMQAAVLELQVDNAQAVAVAVHLPPVEMQVVLILVNYLAQAVMGLLILIQVVL